MLIMILILLHTRLLDKKLKESMKKEDFMTHMNLLINYLNLLNRLLLVRKLIICLRMTI